MHCARDEVLQVSHRIAFRLCRERGVVEWGGRVLRDVGRVHMILHKVREDLDTPSAGHKVDTLQAHTSFRASLDGGFKCTTSWNRCDEFSSGCRAACDSAAASRTTPLALGAAERADAPYSARKSSVMCRVWNESACCVQRHLRIRRIDILETDLPQVLCP